MLFILFNPLANNSHGIDGVATVRNLFSSEQNKVYDITKINDIKTFCKDTEPDDTIVIIGGDGTLNYFINKIYPEKIYRNILYYAGGSGNDFSRDILFSSTHEFEKNLIPLNMYIEHLPEVHVQGQTKYFINGVGFGIDGYCCEQGDIERAANDDEVDYTSIAVKGLFGKFKPCNAKVTVDGEVREYESVWLAPTMLGRFYGGGMQIAPNQDRFNKENKVTLIVWHTKNKLRTIINFQKIFKGTHITKDDMVDVLTGHNITVEFDVPQAMQIDGETISNVTKYTVIYE